MAIYSTGMGAWFALHDGLDVISVWMSPPYRQLQKRALTGQCSGCLANCSDLDYLFEHGTGAGGKAAQAGPWTDF